MYVQATASGRTTLFDVNDSEITTGDLTFDHMPVPREVEEALGLFDPTSPIVQRLLSNDEQPTYITQDGSGQPNGWVFGYAYWWDWEKGFLRLVVAPKMYILGDNGKTIRRV